MSKVLHNSMINNLEPLKFRIELCPLHERTSLCTSIFRFNKGRPLNKYRLGSMLSLFIHICISTCNDNISSFLPAVIRSREFFHKTTFFKCDLFEHLRLAFKLSKSIVFDFLRTEIIIFFSPSPSERE